MSDTVVRRYGWVRDLPDHRDFMFTAPMPVRSLDLPPVVDLRTGCPAVYDQGQLGSCTANAIGAAFEFEQMKQKAKTVFMPSRLFIYYNERAMEGTINSDNGAQIRDGIKSTVKLGVCPETMWPYDVTKFAVKPAPPCYTTGLANQVVTYLSVAQNLTLMKQCLAAGYPFVFGFSVYSSFESDVVAKTGIMPMPKHSDSFMGGHAVMAVGYDDTKQWVIVRNSWGPGWGDHGYFYMPYAYITSGGMASDFWTIRLVETP